MTFTRRVHPTTVKRAAFTVAGVVIGAAGVTAGMLRDHSAIEADAAAASPAVDAVAAAGEFTYQRLADPGRTVVSDSAGKVVATLTDHARTANVLGPGRAFTEPATTAASVSSQTWVRILPVAWTPGAEQAPWFRPWLDAALRDRSPDVLSVATQYVQGGPAQARFGVADTNADGRADRSDFYDYLGTPWGFPDGVELPDPVQTGSVDASGFVRLVFGYRSGLPVRAGGDDTSGMLPRSTSAMATEAPGTVIVPDRQQPVSDFGRLQPGDLVFFDTDPDRHLDVTGIYLGIDDAGHHRFVASRKGADGPTMGDVGGAAVLDGAGDYPSAFRSVKRL